MVHKKILIFLMMGLLAMSFTIPATAADRPAYTLNPEDVPGWTLYKEGLAFNWTGIIPGLTESSSISAWYQIWINNNTWANATAGMVLLVVDLGQDVDNFPILGGIVHVNLWNLVMPFLSWFNDSAEEKTIAGLTKALIWKSSVSSTWWGLGYSGHLVIFALGKGDETVPGNPFTGGLVATKSPVASGASQSNILSLMAAQGGALGGGIPGFTVAPIFIAMAVLFTIIFLFRKDQLHLLK